MANAALILAAGKGTRMNSEKPKVLHNLLAEPMLAHVLRALRPLFKESIWTVVGHKADQIRAAFAHEKLSFIMQAEQKGTGHALLTAMPTLVEKKISYVLVVNGDTPLLNTDTVRFFMNQALDPIHKNEIATTEVAFASIFVPHANSYGRVVRLGEVGSVVGEESGDVLAIVEAKDYDEEMYGFPTGEVNAGLYMLYVPTLVKLIPMITNKNKSNEFYITDLVKLAVKHGHSVRGILCGSTTEDSASLMGVNNPIELIEAEMHMTQRHVAKALSQGVMIHSPQSVVLGAAVQVEPGAEIFGPCEIYGKSIISKGAVVQSHCVLRDAFLDEGAQVHNFSHIQQARVGKNASVGPFGRLRPGAVLEEGAKIGNFVEMKNATLGKGAKASHLSYIGDAEVGEEANIGAGTITCNYDGKNKFTTKIGKSAFIGSNTALVAPVTVGDGALVGAGSVITKDVPQGQLGISRSPQKLLPRK